MRRWMIVMMTTVLVGAAWSVVAPPMRAAGQEAPAEESLYDRLGGVYQIAAAVDVLVDRMIEDEVLAANPYLAEALGRVPAAGLKYQVTSMLCAATGGPEGYHGRSMKDAHAHLRISGKEWKAFVQDLRAALAAVGTDESAVAEVMAIVEGHRDAVVTATEAEKSVVAPE